MNAQNTVLASYRQTRWLKKTVAYFLTITLLLQHSLMALATPLSSLTIQADLDSNPSYVRSLSSNHQYVSSDFMEQSAPSATTLASFYQEIFDNHKHALGEPTYVPIGVGDITTIIPIYEKPKFVGTSLVQSRYVRYQIQKLLGRNLIDGGQSEYASEAAQLNTLYSNAIQYIQNVNSDAAFGENLDVSQAGGVLVYDMIWPEYRTIHGEKVLVPIVYLTQATIDARKVKEHVIELPGTAIFNELIIDNVSIRTGRDSFLQAAGQLLNNQGLIIGDGNLQIVVDGKLKNMSGVIQAEGDLVIGAHSITSQTLVHRYDFGNRHGGRFGEVAEINSTNGNVVLRTYEDILIEGGIVSAGGEINFGADGSIYVGPVSYTEHSSGDGKGWSYERTQTQILRSHFTAEDTIKLVARGGITLNAVDFVSDQGHIELLADYGITIIDDSTTYQYESHSKFGDTTTDISAYKTVAIRSILDAGKGVRIHSELGNITLRSVDINSTEGTSVSARNGALNMLMTVEQDHYSYTSVSESLLTISTTTRGHSKETPIANSIIGGFDAEVLYGVNVEYEGDPDLSHDAQVEKLAGMPGLEWMANIRDTYPEANWEAVDAVYEEWDKSSTTLSPAAVALISVIVAVTTAGSGAALIGATSSSVPGAIANAALTSMVTTASVATANGLVNGEDPFQATISGVKSLTSKEGIRSLATAMVTAGAIASIDANFFDADALSSNPTLTNTETIIVGGVEKTVNNLSFTGQAIQATTHAVVKASVQTLASDGDFGDFEDAFKVAILQSTIDAIGKELTESIANAELTDAMKYIANASTACLTGALTAETTNEDRNSACITSAGGSVIRDLVEGGYDAQTEPLEERQQELADWLEANVDGGIMELAGEDLNIYIASGAIDPRTAAYVSEFSAVRTQLRLLTAESTDTSRIMAGLTAFMVGASASDISISDSVIDVQAAAQVNSEHIRSAAMLHEFLNQQETMRALLNTAFTPETLVELGVLDDLENVNAFDHVTGEEVMFMLSLDRLAQTIGQVDPNNPENGLNEFGLMAIPFVGVLDVQNLRKEAINRGVEESLSIFQSQLNAAYQDYSIENRAQLQWYLDYYAARYAELRDATWLLDWYGLPGPTTAARAARNIARQIENADEAARYIDNAGGFGARNAEVDQILNNASGLDEASRNLLRTELINNSALRKAFKEDPNLVDIWKSLKDSGIDATVRADIDLLKKIASVTCG